MELFVDIYDGITAWDSVGITVFNFVLPPRISKSHSIFIGECFNFLRFIFQRVMLVLLNSRLDTNFTCGDLVISEAGCVIFRTVLNKIQRRVLEVFNVLHFIIHRLVIFYR
jgi:hypothetical protein